jgi:hypothetical protein
MNSGIDRGGVKKEIRALRKEPQTEDILDDIEDLLDELCILKPDDRECH